MIRCYIWIAFGEVPSLCFEFFVSIRGGGHKVCTLVPQLGETASMLNARPVSASNVSVISPRQRDFLPPNLEVLLPGCQRCCVKSLRCQKSGLVQKGAVAHNSTGNAYMNMAPKRDPSGTSCVAESRRQLSMYRLDRDVHPTWKNIRVLSSGNPTKVLCHALRLYCNL